MPGEMVVYELPEVETIKDNLQKIRKYQNVVKELLVDGLDYGIIPGTQKPSLLKPGAEKLAKIHGLADTYDVIKSIEDWDKPFFNYLVKCTLTHLVSGKVISEGIGSCNSLESKYRWRWVYEKDIPSGFSKDELIVQERTSKKGGYYKVYRIPNDDIFSQVNTIQKMAKKRAMVDATLSACRLSAIFTQDIEDIIETTEHEPVKEDKKQEPPKEEHSKDSKVKRILSLYKMAGVENKDNILHEVSETTKRPIKSLLNDLTDEEVETILDKLEKGLRVYKREDY
jgi:hypothetical protein